MVSQKTPYLQANSINAAASSVLGVKRENYFSKRGYTIRQNIYIFFIDKTGSKCMYVWKHCLRCTMDEQILSKYPIKETKEQQCRILTI